MGLAVIVALVLTAKIVERLLRTYSSGAVRLAAEEGRPRQLLQRWASGSRSTSSCPDWPTSFCCSSSRGRRQSFRLHCDLRGHRLDVHVPAERDRRGPAGGRWLVGQPVRGPYRHAGRRGLGIEFAWSARQPRLPGSSSSSSGWAIGQLRFDTDIVRIVTVCTLSGFALVFGLSFGPGTRDITRNIIAGFYARRIFPRGIPLRSGASAACWGPSPRRRRSSNRTRASSWSPTERCSTTVAALAKRPRAAVRIDVAFSHEPVHSGSRLTAQSV